MPLYRLKRGVYYHQGRRIAANSKTGQNVVELPDNHPMLKEVERWERVGGEPQPVPAVPAVVVPPDTSLGDPGDPTTQDGAVETGTDTAAHDPTASPERDAVANSPLSSPLRDWYTYTIPQAVHHVRAATDLTVLAQFKNLELAPKLGKQRSRVLEALDERAQELRKEG